MKKKDKVRYITQAAMIAAIYVVLVFVFNYWSFGVVQFRIAEALTVLPYFTSAAIPGLFAGCILANVTGGAVLEDIVFGSMATLIGAIGSRLLKRWKWAVPIPPILANTVIVPFVLKFGYGAPEGIPYMMATVGLGEIIVCYCCGMILLFALNRYRRVIFGNE